MENRTTISLLHPGGTPGDSFTLRQGVYKDLELELLLKFMSAYDTGSRINYECVEKNFMQPYQDEKTIVYRQDIVEYLLRCPALLEAFEKLVPLIETMSKCRPDKLAWRVDLFLIVSRIKELETYIHCIDILKGALDDIVKSSGRETFASTGLQSLFDFVNATCRDASFIHMRQNLPALSAKIHRLKSISIGVNLSDTLKPVQATISSISDEPFTEKSDGLFNKLFSERTKNLNGITPLRTLGDAASPRKEHLFTALFEDLSHVLEKLCDPIQRALRKYIRINTQVFLNLREDLVFYVLGVRLLLLLQKNGMPVCKPVIAAASRRFMEIDDNYNIDLFVQMHTKPNPGDIKNRLVSNNVRLDEEGRIIILTGPNQGGKTVYLQGIGLTQILFQTGLYVPGSKAVISPADNIFTHFQQDESIANETGRFADEAKRISEILGGTTSRSLLLMNESFASTNYIESLYIAEDIMRILCLLGLRAVYSTHFHDLAASIERINSETAGRSKLVSMVSKINKRNGKIERTYKIIKSAPEGKSYAREIALKYGIGFDQLQSVLQKRGIIAAREGERTDGNHA